MQVEKTVFISYRRTNVFNALAIYQHLISRGFDVFFDYNSINSGSFEQIILNQIAARAHFVVLLTPSALHPYNEPIKWLRRQLERAIELQRHILLVTFPEFGLDDLKPRLEKDFNRLLHNELIHIPTVYTDESIQDLLLRLKQPVEVKCNPVPKSDLESLRSIQIKARAQLSPSIEERLSELWVERGFNQPEADKAAAIGDFTEALGFNPHNAAAYHFRGVYQWLKEDLNAAWADLTQALYIDPQFELAWINRGGVRGASKDYNGAIDDYTRAIELNTQSAAAYRGRGLAKSVKGDYADAIDDYDEAIRLDPESTDSYFYRSIAHEHKGDLKQSKADYQRYLDLGGEDIRKILDYLQKNEGNFKRQGWLKIPW